MVDADGVGTGKTEIGLAFIEEYALRGGCLAVVCPAQLKENWEKRIAQERLPAQVLSFNELASDEQLVPARGGDRAAQPRCGRQRVTARRSRRGGACGRLPHGES